MDTLNPIAALAGGALLGLSGLTLLHFNGRIAGVSGILGDLATAEDGRDWRLAFVVGMMVTGLLSFLVAPSAFAIDTGRGLPIMAAAGVLVGFGTRLGSGCTSGHGICGIARFSKRSLIATCTFIATGAVTVVLYRVLGGGL